ncbi:hypothetical protein OPKNFCMD_3657 [Methylobacterium crusticola]|uniref:Secreted protein n=1 Tax=Methylobacterium crusticola TaxID=1697972 RepID=A0ABQ4R003_9HYPH|nr:hypothetical protein [Methylobacterium crusticola]GJD50908.1 hypothetical protein OPKNFCMD_3657 [Methylobacterium crusticola]
MRAVRLIIGATVLCAVAPNLLQAQTNPDLTGTGGGPSSTITAPYTASTGQTVPRTGRGERSMERNMDDLTRMERRDDAIDKGICTGCD